MRAMRILASVVVVVALGAITAAQASASPIFHSAKYPAQVEGKALNFQGFEGTGVASNCEEATASTGSAVVGEKAPNPSKDSATLEVHPKYSKCILTLLGTTSGEAEVVTLGCNYVFHAAKPNTTEGSTDIKCEAGKQIEIKALFLPGCVITVKEQAGLKTIEYRNEPPGSDEVRAEVSGIVTHIAESCGTGLLETTSKYREGEVVGGKAKLAPAGKPARFEAKTKEPSPGVNAIASEVLANEPHWYENHVPLAEQKGGPGEEGEQALLWGKLVFTDAGTGIGTAECQTEWGGHIYNPEGNSIVTAGPGKGNITAFQSYNCTSTVCEGTNNSKLTVSSEGLGVEVVGGVAKKVEWEANMSGVVSKVKLPSVKLHLVCPKTTGAEYNKKWKGELIPEFESGTSIGSAPAKLTFGTGELEVEAGPEKGKVTNKVKMMGYEAGEIISTKLG